MEKEYVIILIGVGISIIGFIAVKIFNFFVRMSGNMQNLLLSAGRREVQLDNVEKKVDHIDGRVDKHDKEISHIQGHLKLKPLK